MIAIPPRELRAWWSALQPDARALLARHGVAFDEDAYTLAERVWDALQAELDTLDRIEAQAPEPGTLLVDPTAGRHEAGMERARLLARVLGGLDMMRARHTYPRQQFAANRDANPYGSTGRLGT